MASMEQERDVDGKNGGWRFGWMDPMTGKRCRIRLGTMPKKEAERVKGYIQDLVDALANGLPAPQEAQGWLLRLAPETHAKLAEAGLVPNRKPRALDAFCRDVIERLKGDLNPATLFHYDIATREATAYFGKDRDIATITAGHALDFHRHLRTKRGLGVSTAGKRCATMRAIFGDAVRHKLVMENPFADKAVPKATPPAPDSRRAFIPLEAALKVMAELPDAEMRAMFALARFAGVRHDEPYKMTWADVDFANSILRIPCPKTERKTGKTHRECPLFAEVERALLDLRDAAPEGEPYLLPTYRRKTKQCASKKLKDAMRRAGVTVWKRPWQNLRSTREIELVAAGNPESFVAEWVGHDVKVAKEHYLRSTHESMALALKRDAARVGQNPGHKPPKTVENGTPEASDTRPRLDEKIHKNTEDSV